MRPTLDDPEDRSLDMLSETKKVRNAMTEHNEISTEPTRGEDLARVYLCGLFGALQLVHDQVQWAEVEKRDSSLVGLKYACTHIESEYYKLRATFRRLYPGLRLYQLEAEVKALVSPVAKED